MDGAGAIVLGGILVVAIALFVSYNRFIEQRNLIRDSWSNIDTELQRRYDLIPNLVATVKGYAAHERELFEEITRLRAQAAQPHASHGAKAVHENQFVQGLQRLFAVAEAYPDLKANENFLELQRELTSTEDRLQASRRFYNANVRDFNRRVQSVPSNLIAGMFSFREEDYFKIDEAIRRAGPPAVAI